MNVLTVTAGTDGQTLPGHNDKLRADRDGRERRPSDQRRKEAIMRIPALVMLLLAAPALAAAAPATTPPPAAAAAQAPAPATEQVLRAAFTSGIKNREPVNNILSLGNNEHRIYYFTDLKGLQGQTVTHRWLYGGKVMAEVHFQVKGPRWRVWSSKELLPGQLGVWRVQVLDGAGRVIQESHFTYTRVESSGAAH